MALVYVMRRSVADNHPMGRCYDSVSDRRRYARLHCRDLHAGGVGDGYRLVRSEQIVRPIEIDIDFLMGSKDKDAH
jgi:hypothetical protein